MQKLKKLGLAKLPTPLEFMPNLTKKIGKGNLYIKREDLTDIGLSGNKIRKLEYLLCDALDQGCDTLLTYGGVQTNHGRLTTAMAVKMGMKSILVLKGEKPDYLSGNLLLDQLMGADIYFAENDDVEEIATKVMKDYENKGHKIYEIPTGGSNEIGAFGYLKMVEELMEQIKHQNISPKYLVVACGSLGTFAGLWAGAKYYDASFEVLPIAVNPQSSFREDKAAALINKMSEKYGLNISCKEEDLKIIFDYAGIGYNEPDKQTQEAIKLLAQTEAIFVDPCYSGKSFCAFVHIVKNMSHNEDMIFVHTGGIPALWTKEHLDAFQI